MNKKQRNKKRKHQQAYRKWCRAAKIKKRKIERDMEQLLLGPKYRPMPNSFYNTSRTQRQIKAELKELRNMAKYTNISSRGLANYGVQGLGKTFSSGDKSGIT